MKPALLVNYASWPLFVLNPESRISVGRDGGYHDPKPDAVVPDAGAEMAAIEATPSASEAAPGTTAQYAKYTRTGSFRVS